MKRCSKCKVEKDEGEFHKNSATPDGLHRYCKPCDKTRARERYLRTREQIIARVKTWNNTHKSRRKEWKKRYYKSDLYTTRRAAKYGISLEDYRGLLEAQDRRCFICQRSFGKTVPHIDHDHESGLVRGLLCSLCNAALGGFGDSVINLKRAIKYLEKATMMNKESKEHVVCSKCSKPAIEGTNPPVCTEHDILRKSGEQETLSIRNVESLFSAQIDK